MPDGKETASIVDWARWRGKMEQKVNDNGIRTTNLESALDKIYGRLNSIDKKVASSSFAIRLLEFGITAAIASAIGTLFARFS